jgi:hypothetical protein
MNMLKDQRAVIHLAWWRSNEARRLIFGWVEIMPTCFPRINGHPFRSPKGRSPAPSLYVARFPMSAAEAESWFEAAANGDLRLPGHPEKQTSGDGQPLIGPPFRLEPANGSRSSARDLPFLPLEHGVMLAHGLFSRIEDPVFASELAQHPHAEWLRHNMFVDLADHPEFLGSLIMVRHPPVVRDVRRRLGLKGDREVELIHVRRWPETDLTGYKIIALEKRTLGLSIPRELSVEHAVTELDWNGPPDRTALAITHPSDGLAWWSEPGNYVRSVQMNLDLVHATRRIVQSIDSKGKVGDYYDVGWRGSGYTPPASVIGEEPDGQTPSNRAWRGEIRRNQRRIATSLGLTWFDNAAAAQTAVRQIIGRARRSFTVIDPYFGPEQVRDFAMAVTAGNVSIRIVTSEECLCRKPNGGDEAVFSVMEKALVDFGNLGWATPEVLVMPGRRAPLHDRFLIADDRLWLSGNSLNAIGTRASVLIELPDPQEVLGHLTPILAGAKPFPEWLCNWRAYPTNPTKGESDMIEAEI